MASRMDVQKRRAWEGRLRRYQASGLAVTRFCEQERVSTHAFYYWAKRIGSKRSGSSLGTRSSKHGAGLTRPVTHRPTAVERSSKHVAAASRRSSERVVTAVGSANSNMAWVHFRWNAAMEVLVPSDCLDAICCLAECFKHAPVERDAAEHTDAFQEVVVRSRPERTGR